MTTLEKLRETARKANVAIDKIESAKRREENGALVGKAFKIRNNYSVPEKRSDYWWLYSRVTHMDKHGYLFTTEFKTDKYGYVSIRTNQHAYHMQGHRQISEKEFANALAKMRQRVRTFL